MSEPSRFNDANAVAGEVAVATQSFDLLTEPWIRSRLHDGTVRELSIRDAFREATEIREIVGDIPTQSFAIVRVLLAVLYRSVGQPFTPERWKALWDSGLPLNDIDEYLTEWSDRFDLLDSAAPFFQVADLHTQKGEMKDVTQLIFDLPSNNRLFTTRAGTGIDRLSFAEAARWVVNTQAFDASGIKSGAVGDERVKGGKGYPLGVAWSGLLGGVLVEGADLRETLLLNLVAPGPYSGEWNNADLPPWEREPDGAAEREDPYPTGPVDLYTWQSRRIRLVSDGIGIVRSLVGNGDKLTPQNMYGYEMMSAWRLSAPQSKKFGRTVYMPREHQPERAFWRGIAALLPKSNNARDGKDASASLAPGVIQWLSFLQSNTHLAESHRIRLRATGVIYGSNSSVIDEVIDDRLLVSLALLRESNTELASIAEQAVNSADEGVWALRRLAGNLAKAAGGDGEGSQHRAGASAYAALDTPYRRWLASLGPATDPTAALREWKSTAQDILRVIGDELVQAAGPAAWAGRELNVPGGKDRTELFTTSRAENWFRLALHKALGNTSEKESVA